MMSKYLLTVLFVSAMAHSQEVNFDLLNITSMPIAYKGRLNPDDFLGVDAVANETALVTSGVINAKGVSVNFRNRYSYYVVEGSQSDRDEFEWQELSIDHLLADNLIVNIGKTQLPWDMAMSFQPLGFFQRELNITDLTDSQSRSAGLPLIAFSYLATNWQGTLVYSHDFENQIDGFNQGLEQWAGKWAYTLDQGEVALVMQKPQGQPIGFGLQANYTLNDSAVFYTSIYVRKGTRRPQDMRLLMDDYIFMGQYPFSYSSLNSQQKYSRYVVGLSWQLYQISFTTEYSYDERGLDDTKWRKFIDNNTANLVLYHSERQALGELALYYDNQAIIKTGTRQKYWFVNALMDLEQSSLGLFVKIDGHDFSSISGATFTHRLNDATDLSLSYYHFAGSRSSELGSLPIKSEFELMFKYLF
ncbi:hypothetical protein [Thalassotalea fusca]